MKHFPIPVREIAQKHLELWSDSDPSLPETPCLRERVEDAINEAIQRWTRIQNEEHTPTTD
jgi:hypothetical protein